MPFLSAGEHAIFDGELVEHRDYGRQIKVESYETTRPETKSGVETYLASGLVKGVGKATARLIRAPTISSCAVKDQVSSTQKAKLTTKVETTAGNVVFCKENPPLSSEESCRLYCSFLLLKTKN
jgi:ATP-dependent exoDNAse (exonuclease V) alpha subunit